MKATYSTRPVTAKVNQSFETRPVQAKVDTGLNKQSLNNSTLGLLQASPKKVPEEQRSSFAHHKRSRSGDLNDRRGSGAMHERRGSNNAARYRTEAEAERDMNLETFKSVIKALEQKLSATTDIQNENRRLRHSNKTND